MKDKKYSLEEVEAIIDNEGLWYAIEHYMSGDSIEDIKLGSLWNNIDKYLRRNREKIMDYIENNKKNDEE